MLTLYWASYWLIPTLINCEETSCSVTKLWLLGAYVCIISCLHFFFRPEFLTILVPGMPGSVQCLDLHFVKCWKDNFKYNLILLKQTHEYFCLKIKYEEKGTVYYSFPSFKEISDWGRELNLLYYYFYNITFIISVWFFLYTTWSLFQIWLNIAIFA